MKSPDVVLQELWAAKDAQYQQANCDRQRFVAMLREQSASLRKGLQLMPLPPTKPVNPSSGKLND